MDLSSWISKFKEFIEAVSIKIKELRDKLDEEHTIGLVNIGEGGNFHSRIIQRPGVPNNKSSALLHEFTGTPKLKSISYASKVHVTIFVEYTLYDCELQVAFLKPGVGDISTYKSIPAGFVGYVYLSYNLSTMSQGLDLSSIKITIRSGGNSIPLDISLREVKLEVGKTPSHWTIPKQVDPDDFIGNFQPKVVRHLSTILPEDGYTYHINSSSTLLKGREGAEFTLIADTNITTFSSAGDNLAIRQYSRGGALKGITLRAGTIVKVKVVKSGSTLIGVVIERFNGST